jgi:hypothetical protein
MKHLRRTNCALYTKHVSKTDAPLNFLISEKKQYGGSAFEIHNLQSPVNGPRCRVWQLGVHIGSVSSQSMNGLKIRCSPHAVNACIIVQLSVTTFMVCLLSIINGGAPHLTCRWQRGRDSVECVFSTHKSYVAACRI